MADGRKRFRNLASINYYGGTFLGQSDPSASTSSTSSSRDNVPESQIPSAAPYVPPQAYGAAAYYPQQQAQYDDPAAYYPPQQAQYDEPPQQPRYDQHAAASAPAAAPAHAVVHPDLMLVPKRRGRMVGIGTVNNVPRARVEHAARMWQTLCPTFDPEPTPEEQADLERRADQHSSDFFDDINLNVYF
ncbi:hypothetical protein Bca4012_062981 [Brassica carinata]